MIDDQFIKATKKSRYYGVYIIQNQVDLDIKKQYSLSNKYKFRISTKHSFENYKRVNIIIASDFNEQTKKFFQYDNNNLYPQTEFYIGIEISQGKIYINYGDNKVNDNFSKELYYILTGMKNDE